jgi:hypothetical protein
MEHKKSETITGGKTKLTKESSKESATKSKFELDLTKIKAKDLTIYKNIFANYDKLKLTTSEFIDLSQYNQIDIISIIIKNLFNGRIGNSETLNPTIVEFGASCGFTSVVLSNQLDVDVVAIESTSRYDNLLHNVNTYAKNVKTINKSILDVDLKSLISSPKSPLVCLFDPPWGGSDYKKSNIIDGLYYNGKEVCDFIMDNIKYIHSAIVKLPYNYNFNNFKKFEGYYFFKKISVVAPVYDSKARQETEKEIYVQYLLSVLNPLDVFSKYHTTHYKPLYILSKFLNYDIDEVLSHKADLPNVRKGGLGTYYYDESDDEKESPEYNANANKDNESKKEETYAVVMLCMLNPMYVVGACINAYIQRLFIQKCGYNIKLVIMCDDLIYTKCKSILEKYFDEVINIQLRKIDFSQERYKNTKGWVFKYGWIVYSLNKWQCLNLTHYDKVLFLDIDILPVRKDFYQLFEQNTPSIRTDYHVAKDKLDRLIKYKANAEHKDPLSTVNSYDEYLKMDNFLSLNGGIVLLKPSKEDYNNYVKFTNEIYKNGMYSIMNSGADETSLFYYYAKVHPKKTYYDISFEYSAVPWDDPIDKVSHPFRSYNFLSFVKPWSKPVFAMYKEELIWRYIYDSMIQKLQLKKTDPFVKLFDEHLIQGYDKYIELKKHRYNDEYVKKYGAEIDNIQHLQDKYGGIVDLGNRILSEIEKENKNDDFGVLKVDEVLQEILSP